MSIEKEKSKCSRILLFATILSILIIVAIAVVVPHFGHNRAVLQFIDRYQFQSDDEYEVAWRLGYLLAGTWRITSYWTSTSTSYRERHTRSDFMASRDRLLNKCIGIKIGACSRDNKRFGFDVSFENPDRKVVCTIWVVEEGGQWRIDDIFPNLPNSK